MSATTQRTICPPLSAAGRPSHRPGEMKSSASSRPSRGARCSEMRGMRSRPDSHESSVLGATACGGSTEGPVAGGSGGTGGVGGTGSTPSGTAASSGT
eukprot:2125265-Prymnesium_polylepis.1